MTTPIKESSVAPGKVPTGVICGPICQAGQSLKQALSRPANLVLSRARILTMSDQRAPIDTESTHKDSPPPARRRRLLYMTLGWSCVALGTLGVFLPLLPTTVFLLIAAWSFSRSSPRWHRWLREHAHFGEMICAWEEHHAMPRRAKRLAFAALAASYALTAFLFGPLSLAAIISGICIAGAALYIAHIPVLQKTTKQTAGT